MNRYFCGAWCATHAGCDSAECVNVPKAPKPEAEPESAPTQQPPKVPDIYLAELVGVVKRALRDGGLTERLWAILDGWCDEQESYLEKKYPEAHEQAESGEGLPCWGGTFALSRQPTSLEDYIALRNEAIKNGMCSAVVGEPMVFSLNDSGVRYTSSDGQRFVVAENDSECTCQGFQGDNPTCAFHGEGTAWHDLHGGE